MPVGFRFLRRGHLLAGEVCTVRLTLSMPFEREFDERLFGEIQEASKEFDRAFRDKVKTHLGHQFEVVRIGVSRGSITVLVVIGVLGTVYMTISRYKSFREGLLQLVADLRTVAERILGQFQPAGLHVSTSWSPEPALLPLEEAYIFPISTDTTNQILLWYLVLSHAALLLVFLWLVLHGAR